VSQAEVTHYTATERLRDERPVTIRAIRPQDRGLVTEALRNVGEESRRLRFFSGKSRFTETELRHATEVDFVNVVALVAVLEEDGHDRIVGGGRHIRTPAVGAGQAAEVAFLVDDPHRGLGIGSRLFAHLVAIARAAGITQFQAEVLPANEPMLRLFSRSGLPLTRSVTRDAAHLTIDLRTAQPTMAGTKSDARRS
jgi:GNAT superfamily N-acetyltransferase